MKSIVCIVFLVGSFALVEMASVTLSSTMAPRTRDGPRGDGPKRDHEKMCLGQKVKMTAEQNQTMQQCGQKVMEKLRMQRNATGVEQGDRKRGPQEHPHHQRPPMKFLACKYVCMAQAVGLFDNAGKPVSDDTMTNIISQSFPAEAAPKIISALQQCNATAGNLNLEDCSSYRDIVSCYNLAINQACDKDFIVA